MARRTCNNADCGWSGFTHRFCGSVGPLCPDCGETTEAERAPYTPPPETPNDREALRLQLEHATQMEALASWRERGVL